jgi:hypothetical protein
MKKSIVVLFLFLLLACSFHSIIEQYQTVVMDNVNMTADIVMTRDIVDIQLGFNEYGLWCSSKGLEKDRCVDIGDYDKNKLGYDVVRVFIKKYNIRHGTNFNAMRDVKIREEGPRILLPSDITKKPSYYLSGTLLEAR